MRIGNIVIATSDDLVRMHDGALAVLEKVGMRVTHETFLDRLEAWGAKVSRASASYSRASGSIVWATSDFPCDGPMVGETASVPVAAITETTMTWFYKDGSDVWLGDAGVAVDIVGTWHLIGTVSGNLYQVTVDSDGTVFINGFVSTCDGGQIESEEYSVWTGMTRRMAPDGETAGIVLHMHGWAPQGTVSQIPLRVPTLDRVFYSHGVMDQNGVTVDDFVSESDITVPPKPGDVYTFELKNALSAKNYEVGSVYSESYSNVVDLVKDTTINQDDNNSVYSIHSEVEGTAKVGARVQKGSGAAPIYVMNGAYFRISQYEDVTGERQCIHPDPALPVRASQYILALRKINFEKDN